LPELRHPIDLVNAIKVSEMATCMVCAVLHTVVFNRRKGN
jgi:hypothetical protein